MLYRYKGQEEQVEEDVEDVEEENEYVGEEEREAPGKQADVQRGRALREP